MMIDICYSQHQLTLQGEPAGGETTADVLGLLLASVLWYAMYKTME